MREIVMTLPWPPSVNRYWRSVQGRTILSAEGRAYKQQVAVMCRDQLIQCRSGSVEVDILAVRPDKRKRDLDNLLKAALDAMTPWVWADDSQVVDLRIRWAPEVELAQGVKPHGRLIVRVCDA